MTTSETQSRTFKLHTIEEVLNSSSPQWRVHGILPVGGFAMLYAPPAQGKTFIGLDLALSIASGTRPTPFTVRGAVRAA